MGVACCSLAYPPLRPAGIVGRGLPAILHQSVKLGLPANLIKMNGVLKSARGRLTVVGEEKALAGGEVPHHARDEDLSRLGHLADARGQLHGRPEVISGLRHRLAGVKADADLERDVRMLFGVSS